MFRTNMERSKKNEYYIVNNTIPLRSVCDIGKGCEKYDVSIFNAER